MPHSPVLVGLGSAVPEAVITNQALTLRYETSDEWIRSRTGIQERRWAPASVSTGDLAVRAGRAALQDAGRTTVDALILATTTPDHRCPATAPWVAAELGLGTIAAYDIAAVCSGFLFALRAACDAVRAGSADRVLVVGAETFSRILSPEDRNTAVIFGDGAGAVVVEQGGHAAGPGLIGSGHLGSDGAGHQHIQVPAGGSRQPDGSPDENFFRMNGREVFEAAVLAMARSAQQVLAQEGWSGEDVWFVAHQANSRILYAVAKQLGLDRKRVVVDLHRYGNTSAASIPLALDHHRQCFKAGDKVLLAAFGGGFTWGATALTWPSLPGSAAAIAPAPSY